jgi:hypothetical protein
LATVAQLSADVVRGVSVTAPTLQPNSLACAKIAPITAQISLGMKAKAFTISKSVILTPVSCMSVLQKRKPAEAGV